MRAQMIALVGAGVVTAAAAGQHGPAPTWRVEFGTPATDWASGLAPDGAGGVFVSGDTGGDLGGPSAGHDDAFVARYTADGERLWVTQFGTESVEWDARVASDGAGGAFATGRTYGTFIGMPRVDNTDVWLGRLSPSGELLWVQEFGTERGRDAGWDLVSDGADGVFIAGEAEGSLNGGGSGLGAFVARHDGAGEQLWVNQFGVSGGDSANAIDADGAGGIYVAGHTAGDLAAPSAGGSDVFLGRLDGEGSLLWMRQFGTEARDEAHGVASAGAGGVFVAGHTGGALAVPSQGSWDAFVARYDGNGNRLWIVQFGDDRADRVHAVSPDGSGGVMVAGTTTGDLGGAFSGYEDAFIARLDADGDFVWITQFGVPNVREAIQGLALDDAGQVFATGGRFPLYPGDGDAWLARLPLDAGCYADCDTSGELDLFDLLCFQDLFAAAAPRADCDLSGERDIFDLLCFQNAFAAGCP